MIIGGKKFDVEHEIYVMGILNVTPDSFSDGGKYMAWTGNGACKTDGRGRRRHH